MANSQISQVLQTHNLLKATYRKPSITAYNRLEPRPRSQNFERSLRAEVRDPLWMLTRQWQMGEFESEDTGSAIDARILTKQTKVNRFALDHVNGHPFNDEIPMEALVERESIEFKDGDLARTYGFRLKMGQYFLKLHETTLLTKYLTKYKDQYGFDLNSEDLFKGQPEGINLYNATKKRSIDGSKLMSAISNNTFKSDISMDPGDETSLDNIISQFEKWFSRQYSQPIDPSQSAWHPNSLDYQFSVSGENGPAKQNVLEASEYYSGRLDWYSFRHNTQSNGITISNPNPPEVKEELISFLPTPAEFKGMPNPRFWEMEERQINFGQINAKTTDTLLLLFAEFGLIYGNDWSVIPYQMSVNSLCEVKGLVVTDVFGDRILIKAANQGKENNWQRWSMFQVSKKDEMQESDPRFYLPSTIVQNFQSEPLEQVNFMRDEMVNMAWGIEHKIPDATRKGISGDSAADQAGVKPEPIPNSPAAIRYIYGTSVPENWVPFLPIQKPGSVQDIHFQRAVMPKLGNPPVDVVKAKGVLLNEVDHPYFINEHEIPKAGTIVKRAFQRVRWYNGKTYVWIGRYRETGKGEGASNLRFDQIEST